MIGPHDYEDSDTCGYCGVYMAVIGPPGPQHRAHCPVRIEEQIRADESRRKEEAFDLRYGNRAWRCGCVVTARGVEEPCFKPNCELLASWRGFNV